jgi:hypothetical protein
MTEEPNKDSISENRPQWMNGKAIRNQEQNGLFNDRLSSWHYVPWNDRINEQWIHMYMEGSRRDIYQTKWRSRYHTGCRENMKS